MAGVEEVIHMCLFCVCVCVRRENIMEAVRRFQEVYGKK
jgi:hypothetical protein